MPEKKANPRKIYVLDTSVIIFDGEAAWSFEEHDVAIPITVLEELDNFKSGSSTLNLQARQFIRKIDALSEEKLLKAWIPIPGTRGQIKIILHNAVNGSSNKATKLLGSKPDNQILNATLMLKNAHPTRQVILVSQDINLRVKARGLEITAEEYRKTRVEEPEHLYTGKVVIELPTSELVDRIYAEKRLPAEALVENPPVPNQYFVIRNHKNSALGWYNASTKHVELLQKRSGYEISPRNAEQTFAMHAVLNPDVQLVTLGGKAGTGKTLIALAAALEQRRDFRQIYLARPIVALSNRDIGYLPGDAHSKIDPYMAPLFDNLSVIKNQWPEGTKEYRDVDDFVENEKLLVVPLAYIRGRSFSNVIFIVDEAQNLTPHEIKTIVTRAGEKTKIVLTGDIQQIDSPYLNAGTNGLSHTIYRMKGQPTYAHVTLEKGERSQLAELASKLL